MVVQIPYWFFYFFFFFILSRIEFPAIVKLEHGSSAVGVKLVQSNEELMQEYELITTTLTGEKDFPGIGLGFDNTLLVMDYLTGSEHDVDVVIFNRQLLAAFISDNGPTREPVYSGILFCLLYLILSF